MKCKRDCACEFSCVRLFATPGTIAPQAPLSMGSSRQESCSGLPCTPQGDLPNPGIELMSLVSPALAGGLFTTGATYEAQIALGSRVIFIILILPIQQHGISLHLFVSSLISFITILCR